MDLIPSGARASPGAGSFGAPRSPFEIDVVFLHILDFVGSTHAKELLNCRLVSTKWNQMALDALNRKGCMVSVGRELVTDGNGQNKLFTSKFGPEITDNNVEKVKTICSNKAALKVSAFGKIGMKLSIESLDIPVVIQSLGKLPNQNITSITYDWQKNPSSLFASCHLYQTEFWNIVKSCSSTLKCFDYCTRPGSFPTSVNEAEKIEAKSIYEQLQKVTFPALTSVSFDLRRYEGHLHVKTLCHLINNSINLQKLKINSNSTTAHVFLTALTLITPYAKARIQELEIPMLESSLRTNPTCDEQFGGLNGFVNVKRLKTLLAISMLQDRVFQRSYNQCMANNFPSMVSYEVCWTACTLADRVDPYQPAPPPRVPIALHSSFNRITHFGMYNADYPTSHPYELMKQFMLEISGKCTSLESFAIDMIYCASLARPRFLIQSQQLPGRIVYMSHEVNGFDEIRFPSLQTLKITDSSKGNITISSLPVGEMLTKVFPNVTRLVLDILPEACKKNYFQNIILPKIFYFSNRNRIQTLEFSNYIRNWMELNDDCGYDISCKYFEEVSFKLKKNQRPKVGPAKIKLEFLAKFIRSCAKLKVLKLDTSLIESDDGRTDFDGIQEKLKYLKTRFEVDIQLV